MASGFTYMYAGLVAIFGLLFLNLAVARICEVRRKSRLHGALQVCAVPKAACHHEANIQYHEAAAIPVRYITGAS